MILSQAQADAVYSAMCSLNNVCAQIQVRGLNADGLELRERTNGAVVIGYLVDNAQRGTIVESYATQADFAADYGLNQ